MAGLSLSSPMRVIRLPCSPPESPYDWELRLLRTPSRSSSRTSESSSSETTLCDSQRRLEDILDVRSDVTLPSTVLKTIKLHRADHSDQLFSPHVPPRSPPPFSKLNTPLSPFTLASEPDCVTSASTHSHKMGQTGTDRDLLPIAFSSHPDPGPCLTSEERIDDVRARDNASSSLGLALETMRHSARAAPATATYSSRLRRLAPPPLQLPPSSSPPSPLPMRTRTRAPRPEVAPSDSAPDLPFERRPRALQSGAEPRSAATFLQFPEDQLSASVSSSEILQWRRRIARAVDAPLSPLSSRLLGIAIAAPPSLAHLSQEAQASTLDSDVSPQSGFAFFDDPPPYSRSLNTSISTAATPPPLRRNNLMSLPPIPYEYHTPVHANQLLSPLGINFRDALTVNSLIAHADKCIEAIRDAALSLCSCSLLKDPDAIAEVCKAIQWALAAVQAELDKTPEDREFDSSDELQHWFHKHWQTMSSLERNLHIFYLFADQVRRNPPRIHRLAGHVDKLHAYHTKFADLARRLMISHEKLRVLKLRTQFVAEHRTARAQADAERMRRREFRAAWYEGRVRRSAMREEIHHTRDTTRELRSARTRCRGGGGDDDDVSESGKW